MCIITRTIEIAGFVLSKNSSNQFLCDVNSNGISFPFFPKDALSAVGPQGGSCDGYAPA